MKRGFSRRGYCKSDFLSPIFPEYAILVTVSRSAPERIDVDFIVIGSGAAGLRAALDLASAGRVLILTKTEIRESNSRYAQGGIAAAIGQEDSANLHFSDTIAAGAGLCDEEAV